MHRLWKKPPQQKTFLCDNGPNKLVLKKLIEIALFTPDVKRTVEFYRKFLGENPDYESEESAEFKLGETKLFIHAKDERDENPEPNFPPGVDHIAFGVEDVEEACEELRSQGIRAEIGPRDFYWGRSAYFRDPGGRLVELHRPEK